MPINIKVFNSQFVNEIKNADTDKIFEKSYFIIQIYNDFNKALILSQSSTI